MFTKILGFAFLVGASGFIFNYVHEVTFEPVSPDSKEFLNLILGFLLGLLPSVINIVFGKSEEDGKIKSDSGKDPG
ncbi:MAG TPA: hypothetical protein VD907_06695 [Verrucomicrobiae bacterium]|nr:hypothetical protein [Verrucomicrobiae bacterium]